jgi:AcrR family transcriptional regulator
MKETTPHQKTETSSPFEQDRKRISGAERRERLLEIAGALFPAKGLQGTTTAALAERARISEPVLYAHFETKDRLFREAVERNIEKRLLTLHGRLELIPAESLVECVERLAEATVSACVSDGANARLTSWALLETPEHAAELHRREIGCVRMMWEHLLAQRFPDSAACSAVRKHLLPYAIQACLAYGFWLAVLRHSPVSAAAVTSEFAAGVAEAAVTLTTVFASRAA